MSKKKLLKILHLRHTVNSKTYRTLEAGVGLLSPCLTKSMVTKDRKTQIQP